MPEGPKKQAGPTVGEGVVLPAEVTAAAVETIRRRGIDAFTVEVVAKLTRARRAHDLRAVG